MPTGSDTGGRLPREQEWEAAAGGPHGYRYPWGNDWEDGICNTREAGLGITSPVALFPRTRQAKLRIEDLPGNVWEWCGSLSDPSEINNPNGPRVLRGGSWSGNRGRTRSANRSWDNPDGRDDLVGFRVVCSSSINKH